MLYFKAKEKSLSQESRFPFFIISLVFSLSCSLLQKPTALASKKDPLKKEKKKISSSKKHLLKTSQAPQSEIYLFPSSKDLDKDLYLRNKSDYHYSLGEVYSLEGNSKKAIEQFKLTLLYDPHSLSVHLRLASEYLKQGLLIEAVEQTETAIKKHPKSVEARLLLGNLYTSMRMYKEALKQYRFVQQTDSQNKEVSFHIVILFMIQKKYNPAKKELLQWLKHPSNHEKARSHYLMGRLHWEQAQFISLKNLKKSKKTSFSYNNQSKRSLSKALAIQPYFLSATMFLAEIYFIEDQTKKAINILDSFQERFGFHKETAQFLSQIYIHKKNYQKAWTQLSYLEELEPENVNYKLQLALLDIELKKYNFAIQRLTEILRDYNSDKVKYYLGAIYEKINQTESALFHFSKISKESDYYPEALFHSAYLYKELGFKQKSKNNMKMALSLDKRKQKPSFFFFYASLFYEEGDREQALNILEEGVRTFPDETQLIFYLGTLYVETGRKERGIQTIKELLERDKNHLQAMNFLAYIYADMNLNLDVAENLVRKALRKKPKDGHFLDTLGWVLYKKGKTKEAIKYLEDAYRRESDQSIIAEHLADAYYRLNLAEKAKTFYKKALNLEKDQKRMLEIERKILALEP